MTHLRVSICGFTALERATFETFFLLTGQRALAYVAELDARRADFIIADADDDAVCRDLQVLGRLGRTLMVGRSVRAAAAAQLPRPINLMLVIRALDGLSAKARASRLATLTPSAPSTAPTPLTPPTPASRTELDRAPRHAALPTAANPRDLAATHVAVAEAARRTAAAALAWPTPAPGPGSERPSTPSRPPLAAAGSAPQRPAAAPLLAPTAALLAHSAHRAHRAHPAHSAHSAHSVHAAQGARGSGSSGTTAVPTPTAGRQPR